MRRTTEQVLRGEVEAAKKALAKAVDRRKAAGFERAKAARALELADSVEAARHAEVRSAELDRDRAEELLRIYLSGRPEPMGLVEPELAAAAVEAGKDLPAVAEYDRPGETVEVSPKRGRKADAS